jgi:hypothetical protein
MDKQEERILAQLYHYFQNWLEDQTVGWNQRTFDFKQMHKLLKLQQQSLAILLTDKTPMTVEEKVAKAVFYVDENKDTYRVDWNDPDDRCFLASDENTGEGFTIDYDSIPADAYFLGTVRL